MSIENNEQPQMSVSEAFGTIENIRAQTEQMGANDYEPSAFEAITRELLSGEITPERAVSRAQKILDAKMDYH
jgi:hypothetical protein